jgi:hypothetical protein
MNSSKWRLRQQHWEKHVKDIQSHRKLSDILIFICAQYAASSIIHILNQNGFDVMRGKVGSADTKNSLDAAQCPNKQ